MYAHELYEQTKPRIVVTYPGRFQPFHQGHAGVFAQLQKKFGAENVYILTSNDTSSAKSPFNFSDKYQLMTAAGVPGNHIIETNSMYSLPAEFDPASTVFITAVGSPDADRLRPDSFLKKDKKDAEGNVTKPAGSPGYYRTWGKDRTPQTADEVGYVIVIPEIHKSIKIKGKDYDVSHGTDARNLWNHIRGDAEARKEFLVQMYKQPSLDLGAIFDKIPQSTAEDIAPDSQTSTSPIHGGQVYEEAAGVGVIANKKQVKDPRYSMSLTKDVRPGAVEKSLRAFKLAEDTHIDREHFLKMLKQFFPLAMKELNLKTLPKIVIRKTLEAHDGQPTFGRFENDSHKIYLAIADRHPVDVLRTLAHELTHYKQFLNGELYPNAGETGSPIENEAHAVAGVIMRHFNKQYPEAVRAQSIEIDEAWSEKYKRSIDCNNPKGFSQRAHCQGRKKHNEDLEENFADGRNPQDKGDSKRYGIPKKATLSQLDKIGKGSGRKAQLARWQANMRRGRDK